MNLMRIINFIKRNVFPKKQVVLLNEFKTEDKYYTFFFTKHPKWNTPTPNKAEQERLKIIENFIEQIKLDKNAAIIDFGCGRGWLTQQLSKYGNVVGIEPIANVVTYAKKIFPHLNFIVGSIEKLSNQQVDLIVSSEVIEHIDNKEKPAFLKAIYDAIKANGYCIITTPRAEVQIEWLSYRKDNGQPIEQWITESNVQELATSTGFKIISKFILQERANGEETPLLDLYQIWLFQK